MASDGSIYITTLAGGLYGGGTLFQLSPPASTGGTWTATTVFNFPSGLSAGGGPTSVTIGPNGVFYGSIAFGGTASTAAGAIYKLTPPNSLGGTWTEKLIYNFQGGNDGATPNAVTLGPDGSLYGSSFGTTLIGQYVGPKGIGTVFQLTPPSSPGGNWTKTILQQFGKGKLYGPDSPLILLHGNIYGTSSAPKGGVVFELLPPGTPGGAWSTKYLHQFTNDQSPGDPFVVDQTGTIFGTTFATAGQPVGGTIYMIAPN
jgi:hypothetical protein